MASHQPGLVFVDRLAQRLQFDRWGFLVFAAGGSIAIVLAKKADATANWIAVGAVVLMALYAFVVRVTEMGRLRSDQAGDNCYYLGLVYTLASLAYAIFTFDPVETATTIVQGFGVALATTIAGLILRVFFNQTRPDLVDTEDKARLDLAEASSRLKTALAQVTVDMNGFSRQTRQSLDETRTALTDLVEAAVKEGTRGVEDLSKKAMEALGKEYETLGGRTDRVNTALNRVGAALEAHAGSFETLAEATNQAAGRVGGLGLSAKGAQEALAGVVHQAQALSTIEESLKKGADDIGAATARVVELEERASAAVMTTARSLAEVANTIRTEAEKVTGVHESALKLLVDQVLEASSSIEAHNAALAAELARSRETVTKVHASLVDMTERLATRLEDEPVT